MIRKHIKHLNHTLPQEELSGAYLMVTYVTCVVGTVLLNNLHNKQQVVQTVGTIEKLQWS